MLKKKTKVMCSWDSDEGRVNFLADDCMISGNSIYMIRCNNSSGAITDYVSLLSDELKGGRLTVDFVKVTNND